MYYLVRLGNSQPIHAPQKQNAICKIRAQYAKRNCAFELFKANYIATINAKKANFHY
jgi:hypothetical protein